MKTKIEKRLRFKTKKEAQQATLKLKKYEEPKIVKIEDGYILTIIDPWSSSRKTLRIDNSFR